ncbi:MAG: hypothetical protein INQ03_03935 [Candidatus Heimdallarchaeota archaeon]|nr:hypothetical protein [Candidatus Heimdallarchaeota archaeon]
MEKEIFEILKKIAMKDNILKVDETRIIAVSMKNAITFQENLAHAMEDGVITDEEREKLNAILHKMYEEAEQQAMRDNVISDDEIVLLSRLSSYLDDMREKKNL